MDMTSPTSAFKTMMMAPSRIIAVSEGSSTTYHSTDSSSPGNGSSSLVNDDALWDFPWTDEQRRQIESAVVPRQVLVFLGLLLFFVVLFGLVANATILYVFSRFKRLRTPANVFIINLTVCDLLSCLIHPLAVYSAFRGRWSFGRTGCNLYGMGVGFFGVNSIVTLSAIALERYVVITSSSCRSVVAKWRITRTQARKICAGIWLQCAALVAPPWLFGWSSYQPEGALVSCSWDYTTRTLSNRLYYLYLLTFGFVLPVGLLAFCYAAIFRFIVRSSREMTRLIMTSDGRSTLSKTTISFRNKRRQTDVRTALIILSLALACFTAWTPYAVVSLIGQFAPIDDERAGNSGKLSPLLTSIPAFFAKTAIIFNPLVYGFSHPQFRSSVRQMLHQNSNVESSGNNVMATMRPAQQHNNDNNTITMTLKRHHRVVRSTKNNPLAKMVAASNGVMARAASFAGSSSISSASNKHQHSSDVLDKAAGPTSAAILRLERLVNGKAGKGMRKSKRPANNGLNKPRAMEDVRRFSADYSRAESVQHSLPSSSNSDDGGNGGRRASRDSGVSIQHRVANNKEDSNCCWPVQHGDSFERRRASAPDLEAASTCLNNEKDLTPLLFRSSRNLAVPIDPAGATVDDEPSATAGQPEVFTSASPVDGRLGWPTKASSITLVNS